MPAELSSVSVTEMDLCCPQCGLSCRFESSANILICGEHGAYPVVQGIPSFVQGHSFDEHWSVNQNETIPDSKLAAAQRFMAPLLALLASGKPLRVLDDGCGDGVHAQVFYQAPGLSAHSRLTGLDISMVALQTARKRPGKPMQWVHADAMRLPFAHASFDCAFSFGVLAYTENPRQAFRELCRVVQPGGLVGIWIYPKTRSIPGMAFSGVRRLCQRLGPWLTHRVADAIVPFLGWLPTRSGVSLKNASWKQCREVVLVNIQPRQLYFPTHDEILSWFAEENIDIIHEDAQAPITLWGIRGCGERLNP